MSLGSSPLPHFHAFQTNTATVLVSPKITKLRRAWDPESMRRSPSYAEDSSDLTPFLPAFCLSIGLIQKPLKGFTEQRTYRTHSSQSLAL